MDATIIIGIFGDAKYWMNRAEMVAIPSAERQGRRVIVSYSDTLAQARNLGAAKADTEWLIFLDADDELKLGYVDALMAGDGDLRAPAVQWITNESASEPETLHTRDIENMNPCVIGTAIRKSMFEQVGGFQEWEIYEDYALFLKAYRQGAQIVHHPQAVYKVYDTTNSRNKQSYSPQLLDMIQLASWMA